MRFSTNTRLIKVTKVIISINLITVPSFTIGTKSLIDKTGTKTTVKINIATIVSKIASHRSFLGISGPMFGSSQVDKLAF